MGKDGGQEECVVLSEIGIDKSSTFLVTCLLGKLWTDKS